MQTGFWGSSPPKAHSDLVEYHRSHFKAGLERGDYEPYVWPYRSFGIYVLLAYMLLPPTNYRLIQYAKYPVFAFFTYWCIRTIFETKSASLPATYGIGLVDAWAIVWCASLVIFRDLRDLKRVERKLVRVDDVNQNGPNVAIATAANTQIVPSKEETRARLVKNDAPTPRATANGTASASRSSNTPLKEPLGYTYAYVWQFLPSTFLARVDFILDLLTSMRGPGWSHQAHSIQSPPAHISANLSPPPPLTHPVSASYPSRRSLLTTNALHLFTSLILLDILKTYTLHDPYFLGYGSLLTSPLSFFQSPGTPSTYPTSTGPFPPGPAFLPAFITTSPILTKSLRLVLALNYVRLTLSTIFCLSPLCFTARPLSHLLSLRSEPWYYPDHFGPVSYLSNSGLAGFWGAYWHQLFRLGFSAPGEWVCSKLGWETRSERGKVVCVALAFLCSGILHASGSYSCLPPTRPLGGPFIFFVLQGIGVLGEGWAKARLGRQAWVHHLPAVFKRAAVLSWVGVWMYYTAPLLVDDFSRGGIWLFEPVPISFCRSMLGLGEDDGLWWRWRGRNFFFWDGGKRGWPAAGIAI